MNDRYEFAIRNVRRALADRDAGLLPPLTVEKAVEVIRGLVDTLEACNADREKAECVAVGCVVDVIHRRLATPSAN